MNKKLTKPTKKSIKKIVKKFATKTKITNKLKKKIMPKIFIPKVKGRPKGSKNKNPKSVELNTEHVEAVEVQPPTPRPIQEPIKLPDFLEIVEGQSYFASNKGRLTNDEIVENNLEFACTTGTIWNYRFK